jgi:hypothetical protein
MRRTNHFLEITLLRDLFIFAVGTVFLLGCATPEGIMTEGTVYRSGDTYPLFDPSTVIQDAWRHVPVRAGETEYRITHFDGRLAVRAEGRQSASGLLRRVSVDPQRWSWRVERLQEKADLRTKEGDDVAACIFLLFGDPGFLSSPVTVPTLRYVWSNSRAKKDSVVDNPYFPGVVRSVVVQAGSENLGKWVTEKRNVVADYERAFGEKPRDAVHVVALFTDNDQTEEAVEAYYGYARFLCPQGKSAER